jgi:glycosyltransferase involved in cell wall biosynthesis
MPFDTHRPRRVTVIIPCFNERDTVLELLRQVKLAAFDKSIVIVDNCSTDGTADLLRSVCSDEREVGAGSAAAGWVPGQRRMEGDGFTVVLQPKNLRKGTSLRVGLELANSDYVICQDADLEYDPSDIVKLLRHAEQTGDVAVFGSRLRGRFDMPLNSFHLGRVLLTKLFCALYDSDITDVATCYKLLRTDVARSLSLQASGFDVDFEIPAMLRRRGFPIAEVPIRYSPRPRSSGKKIRWHDGLAAAETLFRLRWS